MKHLRYLALMLIMLIFAACTAVAPVNTATTSEPTGASETSAEETSAEETNSDELACEVGFRPFSDEFMVNEATCIPEDPQRIAYIIYPSYLYPFGVKPIAAWGLERDSSNFPALADWINNGVTAIEMPPNLEHLATLQPDLLIFDASRVVDVAEQLAAIAPPFSLMTFPSN